MPVRSLSSSEVTDFFPEVCISPKLSAVAAGLATRREDFPSPLNGPEHGVEHEYRVLGLNRAGEGQPSNTVRAVL